jgi:single-strand DNA-binding protein
MATTTVVGNIAQEIELRYTNAGKPYASVVVAVNEKKFNKQTNQYEDGETWFARGTLWGEFAENVNQSLGKGSRVIGHGRLKQRNYETKQGEKRSAVEIEFDSFGPDLRFATAQVTRASQHGSGGGFGSGAGVGSSGGVSSPQNADSGFGNGLGEPF